MIVRFIFFLFSIYLRIESCGYCCCCCKNNQNKFKNGFGNSEIGDLNLNINNRGRDDDPPRLEEIHVVEENKDENDEDGRKKKEAEEERRFIDINIGTEVEENKDDEKGDDGRKNKEEEQRRYVNLDPDVVEAVSHNEEVKRDLIKESNVTFGENYDNWTKLDKKYYKRMPAYAHGKKSHACWFDLDVMDQVIGHERTELYKKIIEQQSDDIKDINELKLKDLSKKDILEYLQIGSALKEIVTLDDISEKLDKIVEIFYNDVKNKRFPFSEASLKMPRCIIKHKENNCRIETYIGVTICNPYILKLMYLIYVMFEKNFLKEKDYPFTYDVVKCFADAIATPNFNDVISVFKLKEDLFNDNIYKKRSKYVNDEREEYLGGKELDDFIIAEGFFAIDARVYGLIAAIINDELVEFKKDFNLGMYLREVNKIFVPFNLSEYAIMTNRKIEYFMNPYLPKDGIYDIYKIMDFKKSQELGECVYRDGLIANCCIFDALGYHVYYYRNIGGCWFSYDSLRLRKPEIVSNRHVIKLILNSIINTKNFDGYYPDYFVNCTQTYY